MDVLGIDEITYGANDLPLCKRFFCDWGMTLIEETADKLVYETLNGCRVLVKRSESAELPPAIEPGPTLREVVWGVSGPEVMERFAQRLADIPGYINEGGRVGCTDPIGLAVRFQITRKRTIDVECAQVNTWSHKPRRNQRSPTYERATPIEVGHVVYFVKDLETSANFYRSHFGFVTSDSFSGRAIFLRCAPEGGHHNLFLLQTPEGRVGLHHVAFTVRDIHEVFGGGMHMSRMGWETQLGPGRHPISSAYFWYFRNPAGGVIEYYADEDHLDAEWEPREFEPSPDMYAEWAIDGGIDGHTRRQRNALAPDGKFITETSKAKT
ncbi:MAG: dehydrogenase [Noviherbaspirillum sp.]|nr:dehydrogenase [Noviherbaspirillum sp.]